MAERTLVVRLKAVVDDYKKAFGDAGKATDDLVKKGDNIASLGKSTSALGSSLTRNVTLPIVAAGGAAVKFAVDFDNTFTAMQATAGVASSEVSQLKDQVLELSKTTGRGPQELAEALLLIRSSGFEGAEAMAVLEASAKGAAAGMGETREIANALTNVVAGYGSETITAAQAMDILTASVQEGKAEASAMAPQFGRLIPLAAELGIGFDDVAGTLAYLTRSSGDASMSATQLQGILSKLLKPSQQGAEALEAIGLSAEKLRPLLAEDLLGTLVMLRERLGDSGFGLLFDDVQATQAALQLTGSEMKEAREVIDSVSDSAGKADQAFSKWADSLGAKNAQAWAKVQAAMIEFGDKVAPVVADILSLAADLIDVFSELPDWAQSAAVGFLAFAAALGPVLSIGGNLMTAWHGMGKGLDKVGGAFSSATGAVAGFEGGLGRLGRNIAVGGAVLTGITLLANELAKLDDASAKRQSEDVFGFDKLVANLGRNTDAAKEHIERFVSLADHFGFLEDAVKRVADTNVDLAEKLISGAEAAGVEDEKIEALRQVLTDHKDAASAAAGGTSELTGELDAQALSAEAATKALQDHLDTVRAGFDPLFAMVDAIRADRDARNQLTEAEHALNDARVTHGATSAEAMAAEQAFADALDNSSNSTVDLQFAAAELKGAMQTQGLSVEDARAKLVSWAIQAGYTEAQAYAMADSLGFATGRAYELDGIDPTVHVGLNDQATGGILSLREQLAIATSKTHVIRVSIVGQSVGAVLPGGFKAFAKGGPVYKGEGYIVGEEGPEWFEPNANGRIIPNHQLTGVMSSGGGSSGGGTTVLENHNHFHGPVTQDSVRWVSQQVNRGIERNLVNARGRRL